MRARVSVCTHARVCVVRVAFVRSQVYARLGIQPDIKINKLLVGAMLERLRPGGDSANLVYCAQTIAERRLQRMTLDEESVEMMEAVRAAISLFEDVSMDCYQEAKNSGHYSRCACVLGVGVPGGLSVWARPRVCLPICVCGGGGRCVGIKGVRQGVQ